MCLSLMRSLANFTSILVDSYGLEIENLNQGLLACHLDEIEREIIPFVFVVI